MYRIIIMICTHLFFLVRLLYGLCAACELPSTLTVEGCSDDSEKLFLIEEFSKSEKKIPYYTKMNSL